MLDEVRLQKATTATRWVFLICGIGLSSWVPMVPFVKDRLNFNEADLGILLLALGLGALICMPIASYLISKIGSRVVMIVAAVIMAINLPLLMVLNNQIAMAFALFFFGGGIGMIDVSMNFHGVILQSKSGKIIMSSLHGLFSLGGLIGALGLGIFIKMGLDPIVATVCIAVLLMTVVCIQYIQLLPYWLEKSLMLNDKEKSEELSTSKSPWLNVIILLIGVMCFSSFISEGAMLDWSAIFLRDVKNVNMEFSGIGFAVFSIAMAVMRLTGDKIINKLGEKKVIQGGCSVGILGLLMIIFGNVMTIVLLGFLLLGIGLANIIPLLFGIVGKLKGVSTTSALASVTIMGYTGQLVGPAMLGYIAFKYSLEVAFGMLIVLLIAVLLIYSKMQIRLKK